MKYSKKFKIKCSGRNKYSIFTKQFYVIFIAIKFPNVEFFYEPISSELIYKPQKIIYNNSILRIIIYSCHKAHNFNNNNIFNIIYFCHKRKIIFFFCDIHTNKIYFYVNCCYKISVNYFNMMCAHIHMYV